MKAAPGSGYPLRAAAGFPIRESQSGIRTPAPESPEIMQAQLSRKISSTGKGSPPNAVRGIAWVEPNGALDPSRRITVTVALSVSTIQHSTPRLASASEASSLSLRSVLDGDLISITSSGLHAGCRPDRSGRSGLETRPQRRRPVDRIPLPAGRETPSRLVRIRPAGPPAAAQAAFAGDSVLPWAWSQPLPRHAAVRTRGRRPVAAGTVPR